MSKTVGIYDPASNYLDSVYMTIDPVPGNTYVNDFAVVNDTMYVIMGKTDVLRVFNIRTKEQLDTLSLRPDPNYLINANSLVVRDSLIYITGGISNSLLIVNRKNLSVIKEIPVGIGPENITVLGDTLLISASGFDYSSYTYNAPILYLVDMNTNEKVDSIGFQHKNLGPVHVINGDTIYALCRAELSFTYVPTGALYKLKVSTKEVLNVHEFFNSRFVFGYIPEWKQLALGSWGAFDVINENNLTDTLYKNIIGDNGFILYNNQLYVLSYGSDAMYVYDTHYQKLDSIPTGAGPLKMLLVRLSSPLQTDQPVTVVPEQYELEQNYPNPFNPVTTIPFKIYRQAHVKLEVYSITGEKVATLVDGTMRAGKYLIKWDAGQLPSGVYFYRLTVGSYASTKKMILVK
jgi:YVTN family beta-propeller protein